MAFKIEGKEMCPIFV